MDFWLTVMIINYIILMIIFFIGRISKKNKISEENLHKTKKETKEPTSKLIEVFCILACIIILILAIFTARAFILLSDIDKF